MKLRATLALTALVALGLIAAGCGDSSDDSSDSTTAASLTKADWIAQADAICQHGNQESNQAAHQQFGNQKPTGAEIQQFLTGTALPNTQTQIDKIKALGAPSGDEDQVNHILDVVQADIDKAKAAGDLNESTFDDGNALAKQYGLKVCGAD
jgi:ABC-type lipoprotein release transport system permease subunit